jgi:hypothetical protein
VSKEVLCSTKLLRTILCNNMMLTVYVRVHGHCALDHIEHENEPRLGYYTSASLSGRNYRSMSVDCMECSRDSGYWEVGILHGSSLPPPTHEIPREG